MFNTSLQLEIPKQLSKNDLNALVGPALYISSDLCCTCVRVTEESRCCSGFPVTSIQGGTSAQADKHSLSLSLTQLHAKLVHIPLARGKKMK